MNHCRHLLLCVSLLIGLASTAQDPKRTHVLLYKDRLAAAFDTVKCVKNAVKINPLLFFRGEIPIYFERALTPKLSLEVGLGITLRNYLALSFVGDDADDFGAGTEIVPNLSYHMGARWYFMDDLEPVGTYLHVEYAHLVYAKDIRAKGADGQFTDVTYRDERTYNDVRLLFGYQTLSFNNNWLVDFYGGAAFRSRNNIIVTENAIPPAQENGAVTYDYEVTESSDNVPAFFLGFKLGIGF
jgi:hypothetical protein